MAEKKPAVARKLRKERKNRAKKLVISCDPPTVPRTDPFCSGSVVHRRRKPIKPPRRSRFEFETLPALRYCLLLPRFLRHLDLQIGYISRCRFLCKYYVQIRVWRRSVPDYPPTYVLGRLSTIDPDIFFMGPLNLCRL